MITKPLPYLYATDPFAHQDKETLEHRYDKYRALFWEMGCGKSKPIIDTAGALYAAQEIDGVILVSDKGAYLTWESEVPKHLGDLDGGELEYRIGHWSSSQSNKQVLILEQLTAAKPNVLDFICVNIEALSSDRCRQFVERFIRNHHCLMVVDESTSIKNMKADRTKAAIKLGRMCEYRRILTGTPITQSPLDLYAQCEFLNKGLLGFPTFTAFRAHYAQMITMTLGTRSFPKIVGYRNLEQLTESIKKFSSRLLKSECLDLPEKLYQVRHVELSDEQRRLYDQLKETAVLQLDQGLLTSTSALTTIGKLQQICCGHVAMNDGTRVDIASNRLPLLLEILESLGDAKVIIWCAYQRDVEQIYAALKALPLPNIRYPVHYYGKTDDLSRRCAVESFTDDRKCGWFVGTAATGGKSLTLTVASYVIYYSNTYSLEDRLQSEDRAHRIGQDKNVTYIDLVATGTVEERILKSLRAKEDLSHQVLDRLRELLDEVL